MERFAGKRGPVEQQTESRSAIRCLREDLIGMEQVKEQVMETVQVMKFNRLRKEIFSVFRSFHLCFFCLVPYSMLYHSSFTDKVSPYN